MKKLTHSKVLKKRKKLNLNVYGNIITDRSRDIYVILVDPGVLKLAELFKKAEIFGIAFLGVHLLFNGSYILTLFERSVMLNFADLLSKKSMAYNVACYSVYEPENVVVTFKAVHPTISPEDFANHIRNCYNLDPVVTRVHEDPILGTITDTRYVEFEREAFSKNPLKSFVDLSGDLISIKYKGQIQTCKVCDKAGHKQETCPALSINADNNKRNLISKENETLHSDIAERKQPNSGIIDPPAEMTASPHNDPNTPDDVFETLPEPGNNSTPLPDQQFRSTMSLPSRFPHHITLDNSDWSTVAEEDGKEEDDEEEAPHSSDLKRKDRSPEEFMDSARFKKINSGV